MAGIIDLDEDKFKEGILGLVITLVEIIRDALRLQAFRRMEGGSLTEDEIERLGEALLDLDTALDQIKQEHGITDTVQQVRDGLDDVVDDLLNQMLNPERWADERSIAECGMRNAE
ncbi:MAG: gas vesicle protein K [Anaerolineae bacterium]